MPRTTTVLTARIPNATAERARTTAAASGRTINRFLGDLVTAAVGRVGQVEKETGR